MTPRRLRGLIGPPDLLEWLAWIAPAVDAQVDANVVRAQPSAPKGGRKPKTAGSKGIAS